MNVIDSLESFIEKQDIKIHDEVINIELKRNYSIDTSSIKREDKERTEESLRS